MNSLHAQNGNHWLELHSFILVFIRTPPYQFFSLGNLLFGEHGVTVLGSSVFVFLTVVSLHIQKYNTKPSFNLCSSSLFKCLWKKHFAESNAVNNSTIGILLSTCFLIQGFSSRCTGCIFDSKCLILIHYSLFHELVSTLRMQACDMEPEGC